MKVTKAKCGASNPPAMARGGMPKRDRGMPKVGAPKRDRGTPKVGAPTMEGRPRHPKYDPIENPRPKKPKNKKPKQGVSGTPINIEMIGGKKKKPKDNKVTVFNPKTGKGRKKVNPGKNVRYGGKKK